MDPDHDLEVNMATSATMEESLTRRRNSSRRHVSTAADSEFTPSCALYREGRASSTSTSAGTNDGSVPSVKVSWDQKLSTYVHRTKRLLLTSERASISGIGMAVTSVILCAEILRNAGFVDIYSIETSMLKSKLPNSSSHQKPVVEVVVERTPRFAELMDEDALARALRRAERGASHARNRVARGREHPPNGHELDDDEDEDEAADEK